MRNDGWTFSEVLRAELRRSPFWLLSVALNLVAFHSLNIFVLSTIEPPSSYATIAVTVESEQLDPLLEEIRPEIIESRPVEMPEGTFEEPVYAAATDHCETDSDMPFEESIGREGFLSDSPFGGFGTNAAVGMGGGAGGEFSGRGGRQRFRGLLRAMGGSAPPSGSGFSAEDGLEAEGTWRRSRLPSNASKLLVGDEDELPLETVQVSVRVDGYRARVVLDCFFRNDREKQLEGRFKLRLPDGASPFFLAFGEMAAGLSAPPRVSASTGDFGPSEIMAARESEWGTPREARMVPNRKAANAYQRTTRKRVDPALMEWSGAGVFSTKVSPLLPDRLHRIVVGYDVDLAAVGDGLVYVLDLPRDVPDVQVHLAVADLPGLETFPALKATPGGDDIDPDLPGHQSFFLDQPEESVVMVRYRTPRAAVLHGTDGEGRPFFGARIEPEVPVIEVTGRERAVFLIDVSASSNPDRMNVWLELLETILRENRESLTGFAVLFFNVETFWWREEFTLNSPEAVRELMEFAETLCLEGATDLSAALSEADRPDWPGGVTGDYDLHLLSDGAGTWGSPDPVEVTSGSVFAYLPGGTGTDTDSLSRIAMESGGAVFSVVGEEDLRAAAVAHRRRPWLLTGVTVEGGDDVLVAGNPQVLFPGQVLHLGGRGTLPENAEITVSISGPEGAHILRLRPEWSLPTDSAVRAYGEIAVAQLEDLGRLTVREAEAYASHFRVVGRTCSLLMLESEEDYRRFGIRPEDNGATVGNDWPSALVVDHQRQARLEVTDPKAALLADLSRLANADGVEFEVSGELRDLVESVPGDQLLLPGTGSSCRLRTRAGLGTEYLEQLATADLTYNRAFEESQRRLGSLSPADALKALSSLVERDPGNLDLLRSVGTHALTLGEAGPACHLFTRVIRSRPHEAAPWLNLAAGAEALGLGDLALIYHETALAAKWSRQTSDFKRIQKLEYSRLLERIVSGGLETTVPEFVAARYQVLRSTYDRPRGGLLVLLSWSTDRTDIDLHVTDPNEERCFYQHKETRIGGAISADDTNGYGPELFTLPRPIPGEYRIELKCFTNDNLRTTLRTTALVTVYTEWGTPEETVARYSVPLPGKEEMQTVATISLK